MSIAISDIYMDYNQGKIVIILNEAYTGNTGQSIKIEDVISQRIKYCHRDAMTATSTGPKFDAAKVRSYDHDIMQ